MAEINAENGRKKLRKWYEFSIGKNSKIGEKLRKSRKKLRKWHKKTQKTAKGLTNWGIKLRKQGKKLRKWQIKTLKMSKKEKT